MGADRLSLEGFAIVAAGTITTSWTLTVALFHILATPSIARKLRTELQAAIPDVTIIPELTVLEQLPYLKGVVQEALRLGDATPGRFSRLPRDAISYTNPQSGKIYHIPAGTPCSSITPVMHQNETNFPNPLVFLPERWIENDFLEKYLVAFSRGTRACLGRSLAYAEMYLMIAGICRRFGTRECMMEGDLGVLELWETDKRDITPVAEYGIPLVWKGTKGVRVRVLPVGS
jgi:cytochrome P450